jgi:hypothetical protein
MLEPKKFSQIIAIFGFASVFSLIPLWFTPPTSAGGNSQKLPEGLPLRRVGGGTRSDCNLNTHNQLTALIPERTIAKTTSTNPKFYFYLPENTAGKQLEFVLRDQNDRQVYETTFTSNGKSGVMAVELPASQQYLLESNANYHWYLSLLCNPANRSQDIVLEGSIQRVELDAALTQKLARSTSLDRVSLYQSANIWYDALSTLADLKASNTATPVAEKWMTLLESVGLKSIADKPLI